MVQETRLTSFWMEMQKCRNAEMLLLLLLRVAPVRAFRLGFPGDRAGRLSFVVRLPLC